MAFKIRRTRAGITVGATPTDAIGFHGAAPVVQRSNASQAAIADVAGGTYTAAEQTMLTNLKTLTNELRAALVEKGIIKGS